MRIELSTWPAVEDYFQRGNDLVVMAIGSTEEHGRHNPLGTDTLAPNLLLDKIEAALGKDVLIAPTIPFGNADDLLGFPGTLSIGYDLLRSLVRTLSMQLFDYGARRRRRKVFITSSPVAVSRLPVGSSARMILGLLSMARAMAMLLFRTEEGIFRMHVIANSDSAADQATKLAVRDAILDYERGMGNVGSAEEVKARLMDDGRGICTAIDNVLHERGMDYSAELHIGTYDFPDREYGGKLYPAGRYQALRVILGEGKGKNWWCVMFPPLCILEDENGKIEDEAKFDSLIMKLIREAKKNERAE